ncbi:MAG: efflux RND transporter periplasmic adaptor subunit [Burkholderiales bacterium]|jgi:RND family efflux transporter MFP subunit|nr:efflux RND transporter periplasmic adaptor subunit [Burkholderiales bacterium]
MKRRWIWLVAAVLVALLAAGLLRSVAERRAQRQAAAVPTESVIELAPTDVVTARTRTLASGLPVSGSIRAVTSAVIKARVAGELQGLTVREGDAVRAGQVVARIDATEYQARLAQAQQQADSARAQVDIARRQYDNNKALVDQGFISRTALDTSQASLASAEATYRAAQAFTDVARKSLDDTVIRSPIDGQVSQRLAQPGERVAVEARVVEVVDLSRLELEASLPPADSVNLRVGQAAQLRIEGLPQPVAARVARINPVAQSGSRSVLAYLAIQDAAGLRQGLFAQGRIETGRLETLAIPLSAVRTDKPEPYVQLLEGGRVVHRPVKLDARGVDDGEPVVAVTGVPDGAELLAASVGPLREGSAVRRAGAAPMAPTPAAGASAAR